jgi:ferredoxin
VVTGEIDNPKYEVVGNLERFDEIDQIMARGEMVPDGELWKSYYKEHPERESQGRRWAELPRMGDGGHLLDRLIIASRIWTINKLGRDEFVDGEPSSKRIDIDPKRASEKLKGIAKSSGAVLVRAGPLNPAWIYSHIGRSRQGCQDYGTPINLAHNNAIVVAIPLDRAMVDSAPHAPCMVEVWSKYIRLASIVIMLAQYVRSLGYHARAHHVWNYQALMVPIAVDAGLGELARNGILITEQYGNAIKIAAVTTDMPLAHDKPVDIGIDEFCHKCTICAKNCPVGAITLGDKEIIRGVYKFKLNESACYSYFRYAGTDCGICMSVCPWTRPRSFPNNLVLWGVKRYNLVRKLAIKADTLSGRKKQVLYPSWFEELPKNWKGAKTWD